MGDDLRNRQARISLVLSSALQRMRRDDADADLRGGFAGRWCARHGQRLGGYGGNLDREIQPIDQRPGDAPSITRDLIGSATAAVARMAKPSAGTPLRCLFAT